MFSNLHVGPNPQMVAPFALLHVGRVSGKHVAKDKPFKFVCYNHLGAYCQSFVNKVFVQTLPGYNVPNGPSNSPKFELKSCIV